MDTRTYMGEAIKARRKELKISQEEVAERVGTTQNMISKIESGIADPSFQLICDIAKVLNSSPLDFCSPKMGFVSKYTLSSSDEAFVMNLLMKKRKEEEEETE